VVVLTLVLVLEAYFLGFLAFILFDFDAEYGLTKLFEQELNVKPERSKSSENLNRPFLIIGEIVNLQRITSSIRLVNKFN